jgi:hypothetical protein
MQKRKPNIVSVNDRKSGNPLVAFLDTSNAAGIVEELFSKAPEKTKYAEGLLQGASYQDIEKLEPITEKQMKALYPHATSVRSVDPLKQVDKTRIHDNIRRDGSTFMALWLLCIFTLGSETTITLGLNRKYANQQRTEEQLKILNNNPEYLDILEQIMNIDNDIDLHSRQLELLFSGGAFGRSVQVRQYGPDGMPCRYIPISSSRLGRVWEDKYTHEFLGVEGKDYSTGHNILLAKDIIHYEENDFSLTPNSRYYGMSLAETSIAIGERNRAANEIAIPEIMKRYFTPLMKVMTKTRSQAKLNQIRDAWKAGKILFINDDIEVEVIPVQHDLEKVRDTVKEGEKSTYAHFSVPLGVAFPDIQNRSTFEGSMLQWYDGPINFRRRRFSNVMWYQHYKPMLEKILEGRMMERIGDPGGVVNTLLQKASNPEPLPFRIETEYTNIRTVGFLDTAAALAQFHDRSLLEGWMVREESGLGKYNDEMAAVEANKKVLGNNLLTTEMKLAQGPEAGNFGQQGGVPNLAGQSSFENKASMSLPSRTPRDYESE